MTSPRIQRVHDAVDDALDNVLSSLGGSAGFVRCFPIVGDARERLSGRYEDAIASFRANVKAEVRKTLDETHAADDLRRLDSLIAQQPQLKDGRRCLPPARVQPEKAVSTAAAEQRAAHKRKLQTLLDDLEAENEALRGTIDESRSQIASTSMRISALYGGSLAGQLATVS